MNRLLESLCAGGVLLMDGALGTELERHDVPVEEQGWSALAVRDHGSAIREIHKQYISAGAKLHIVNSFALARHVLEPLGLGEQFESLNARSVSLFTDAVEELGLNRDSFVVAGSLSTFSARSDRSALPGDSVLVRNFGDQAGILANASVDVFALEMLSDTRVTRAMLRAVEPFHLPVIVGLTCEWEQGDTGQVVTRGMGHEPQPLHDLLPEIIDSVGDMDACLSIMHSDMDVTHAALGILREQWKGSIAIYPNSGHFVNLRLQFDSVCGVDEFCRAAMQWIDNEVDIVGGCCGIGPGHIQGLARLI